MISRTPSTSRASATAGYVTTATSDASNCPPTSCRARWSPPAARPAWAPGRRAGAGAARAAPTAAAPGQGFSACRVRHHGDVGRIELPTDELPRAMEPAVREALVVAGKETGFRHVTIDLDGIRSGLFSLHVLNSSARPHG